MNRERILALAFGMCVVLRLSALTLSSQNRKPDSSLGPHVPKAWDRGSTRGLGNPVAGLDVRPGHVSEKELSLPKTQSATRADYSCECRRTERPAEWTPAPDLMGSGAWDCRCQKLNRPQERIIHASVEGPKDLLNGRPLQI
jgi:hypothetical protein